MANTLILVDRRDDPWGGVTANLEWSGGGYSRVAVDRSGRGQFVGTGTITNIRVAGETIPVYARVSGNSTVVAHSEKAH